MSWAELSYYCSTRLNYCYYYCYSSRSSDSPAVGQSQRQRRSRSRAAAAGHWRRFDCLTNAAFGWANLRSNALSHKLRRWRRRRSTVVNHKKTSREKLWKGRSNWKVENWRIEKVSKTETITNKKGNNNSNKPNKTKKKEWLSETCQLTKKIMKEGRTKEGSFFCVCEREIGMSQTRARCHYSCVVEFRVDVDFLDRTSCGGFSRTLAVAARAAIAVLDKPCPPSRSSCANLEIRRARRKTGINNTALFIDHFEEWAILWKCFFFQILFSYDQRRNKTLFNAEKICV